MWTANAPALLLLFPCSCIAPDLLLACSKPALGLLMVCSYPAPDPALPSFAAFIIISTLRLFSARREPPFMVILHFDMFQSIATLHIASVVTYQYIENFLSLQWTLIVLWIKALLTGNQMSNLQLSFIQ